MQLRNAEQCCLDRVDCLDTPAHMHRHAHAYRHTCTGTHTSMDTQVGWLCSLHHRVHLIANHAWQSRHPHPFINSCMAITACIVNKRTWVSCQKVSDSVSATLHGATYDDLGPAHTRQDLIAACRVRTCTGTVMFGWK